MNCRQIEPLLLAERDGVLTSDQHAVLANHLAGCAACRESRATYGEAVAFLKTDAANIAVPDVNEEWRAVRARLHAGPAKPAKKRPLAPVIWFGAPLAAAAALAFAFFVGEPKPGAASAGAMASAADATAASTIAYVDSDSGWLVVWTAPEKGSTSG